MPTPTVLTIPFAAMFFSCRIPKWLALCLLCTSVLAIKPQLLAELDYGTFQGAYSAEYNISYWQKIPFAAPPIGENRFRAPQPPLNVGNATYNSTQTFDMCPQRTVNGSEDCLYLGLYSRPWEPSLPLRPILIVIFSGGYIRGSASFTIPPSSYPVLNVSDSSNHLAIYPNYRTNAFGFLPGRQINADPSSDLNPGLLDQRAAIEWARKYGALFGGDPNDITIWGQSAGGGSVIAQVLADAGMEGPPLITRALTSSPYWPKTYRFDAPQAQQQYDLLAEMTGCGGEDSLACLKAVDVQTIRDASLTIIGLNVYTTSSFAWAPVIDNVFLKEVLSTAAFKGRLKIEQGFGMYNEFEGETFIPPALNSSISTGSPVFNSSEASFGVWLRGFLPGLSARNIERVKSFYPANGTAEVMGTYSGSYARAQLIYRDVVLACPTYWFARAANNESYVGEYTIAPAMHANDTYWWDTVDAETDTPNLIYDGYTGAFASFFQTGNPNAHKLTNGSVPGVPESWQTGDQFVITTDGFENVKADQLNARCEFWRNIASQIPI